jgi:hypothetical protein
MMSLRYTKTMQPMSENEILALHHRHARRETLTNEEEAILNAYLAQRDAAEMALLAPAFAHHAAVQKIQDEKIIRLETVLERKKQALARLESLVREIEAIKIEENAVRALSPSTGKAT